MKSMLVAVSVCALAIPALIQPADARGCLKGAAVGGVAGHYAGHHGWLGAAAGCLVGRHEANKHDRMQRIDTNGTGDARDVRYR